MTAIVAIIVARLSGEPLSGFPDVALLLHCLDNRHPPVKANQNHKSDQPFEHNEEDVKPAEQQQPQTAVLTFVV